MIEPTDIIGDDVRLYRGDALDVLTEMADSSIDCIVTDPPYCAGGISESQRTQAPGQGLRSETIKKFGWFVGDNMTTGGLVFLLRAITFEACRVMRPGGSMVVFCDWRLSNSLAPAIESAGVRYQDEIIWDKGSMGLGNGFRKQHEKALLFTFGSPKFHAADVPTVLRVPRIGKDDREHQTQKPVKLLREILRVVCPGDGEVCDPFAGSGSTGLAAIANGQKSTLIERDPEHYATALRRLTHATGAGPGQLFGAAS